MADLDNSLILAAGFAGIVKQAGASAEVVCDRALTQGEAHVFEFTVLSVDNNATSDANLQYAASLIVYAIWDTTDGGGGATWKVAAQAANESGTASATWAASMSGDTMQITANGAAGWLHMASLKAGAKTEFAAEVGVT